MKSCTLTFSWMWCSVCSALLLHVVRRSSQRAGAQRSKLRMLESCPGGYSFWISSQNNHKICSHYQPIYLSDTAIRNCHLYYCCIVLISIILCNWIAGSLLTVALAVEVVALHHRQKAASELKWSRCFPEGSICLHSSCWAPQLGCEPFLFFSLEFLVDCRAFDRLVLLQRAEGVAKGVHFNVFEK